MAIDINLGNIRKGSSGGYAGVEVFRKTKIWTRIRMASRIFYRTTYFIAMKSNK
jgi:hypothetical protein